MRAHAASARSAQRCVANHIQRRFCAALPLSARARSTHLCAASGCVACFGCRFVFASLTLFSLASRFFSLPLHTFSFFFLSSLFFFSLFFSFLFFLFFSVSFHCFISLCLVSLFLFIFSFFLFPPVFLYIFAIRSVLLCSHLFLHCRCARRCRG